MSNTATRLLLPVALCCAISSTWIRIAGAGEADDAFAIAASHYSAQRWEMAVAEFRTFLHDYPENAKHSKAMFFEGQALMQLGRNAEAYSLFVDLLDDEPSGVYAKQALFSAAESAVLSGKTAEAEIRLSQFQAQYPADKLNANVLMYRGDLAANAGNTAQATQFYRDALQRFGDQPSADQCRLSLAHLLETQKQSEAAEQLLHDVAQHDHSPWSETALLQLADKDLAAKKPQAALEEYEAVEKRFPNSPLLAQTHLGCGRALYQLGHYAEAQGVLIPLSTTKQLGADARYWIAMSQKAEKQRLAAAAREAEINSIEAKSSRSDNSDTVDNSSPADKAVENSTPQAAPVAPKQSVASSRRDPKNNSTAAPQASSVAITDQTEIDTLNVPDRSEHSVKSPAVANKSSKLSLQQPVSEAVAEARDDQSHRRSATILNQAASNMMQAGQINRAIATLQMGDNSGDDPRSLGNRYLLAIALQDMKRNDEALQTLNDLSAQLQTKLATGDQSASNSSPIKAISSEDLAAFKELNDNVQLACATMLLTQEKYAEAIAPLQIYLVMPRNDVGAEHARSALAISLAKVGRAADARQVLDDLKSNHPESKLILVTTEHVAQASYAAGQYAAAAKLFHDMAANGNPNDLVAEGLSGAAACHIQLGENDLADQEYAKFLERFGDDPHAAEAALARGQLLEHAGKDQAAASLYRQAIKRYAQSKQMPQLLCAAARLNDRLEQNEEAAKLYQRLVRDYPTYPDIDSVLYSWAWTLRDSGHGNESDKVFRMLYEDHPHSRYWSDATYRLAERASQQSDPDAAAALLKQLMTDDCPSAVLQHALYLQGQIAINEEKWNAAEAPLSRLVHDFPNSSLRLATEFWLAEIAYRSGDYALAQQRFDTLAPRVTDHSEAWTGVVPLRRAQILAQQKQWKAAGALAESIAADYPQFKQQYEADYLIGQCKSEQGDFDGARTAFLRVVHSAAGGKTETAAMAQWEIGQSYFQQSNFTAALREYLQVEVVYPYSHWQAASLLQAAKCYEHLDQPQQAAELYGKVLQDYPQTEFVAEASKRLIDTTRR